jgi:hypothetical protein
LISANKKIMAPIYFTTLNERSNCSENVVFAMLYTHNWSMALGVLTSLINIAIVTPMSIQSFGMKGLVLTIEELFSINLFPQFVGTLSYKI